MVELKDSTRRENSDVVATTFSVEYKIQVPTVTSAKLGTACLFVCSESSGFHPSLPLHYEVPKNPKMA